ncbi:MAG: hypothetical protein ACFCVK_04115 [Acidimicrobiales bacterium]
MRRFLLAHRSVRRLLVILCCAALGAAACGDDTVSLDAGGDGADSRALDGRAFWSTAVTVR